MNELINTNIKTMSSLEISKLCEKEHRNVMNDIKHMLEQLEIPTAKFSAVYKARNNQDYDCFNLDKELSLTLVAGYNVKLRHKIVKRWQELEKQNTPQFSLPQNYKEALQALLIEVDKTERLQLENHALKPKADFYDTVTGSKDTIDMGAVAKILNIKDLGRNKLFAFLRIKGVLNQQNRPYQCQVDKGYFRLVESSYNTPDGTTHVNIKTVVFQKGLDFIRKLVSNNSETLAELENN